MSKPFVICHMLTSLDGKIDGDFMSTPACAPALQEYGRLRGVFGCNATMYGTNTMAGGYAAGIAPPLPEAGAKYLRKDYIAPHDVENYIVSVDPQGVLAFSSAYLERKGRPRAHVIEVLTQKASDAYLAYLHGRGISYLFAGEDTLDFAVALQKLQGLFGIDRVLLAGGGLLNWSFAHQDLIDELSLVIAPVADGRRDTVSIFERADFLSQRDPVTFTLKEVRQIEGSVLCLRYAKK